MGRDGAPATLNPEAKNEPDLYMVNAIIDQYDEGGQPKHKIKALKLTHYPATDITTLEHAKGQDLPRRHSKPMGHRVQFWTPDAQVQQSRRCPIVTRRLSSCGSVFSPSERGCLVTSLTLGPSR